MIRRTILGLALAAPLAALGCDLIRPTGVAEITQLQLKISLEQDTIAPGDSTTATAQIINVGGTEADITVSGGCIGTISVHLGNDQAEFGIDPNACWSVQSPLHVGLTDTISHSWKLVARTDSGPVAEAAYLVFVDFNGTLNRGGSLTDVGTALNVRTIEPQ